MAGFSTSLANAIMNATLRNQPTLMTPSLLAPRCPCGRGQLCGAHNGVTYDAVRAEFPSVIGAQITVTHVGIMEGDSVADGKASVPSSKQLPACWTSTCPTK